MGVQKSPRAREFAIISTGIPYGCCQTTKASNTSNSSVPSSLFLQKPVKHSDPHTRHYQSCKHKMQQLKLKFCRGCYHSLCLLWTTLRDFHFAIGEVFKQQEIKGFYTCFFTVVYIAQLCTLLKS